MRLPTKRSRVRSPPGDVLVTSNMDTQYWFGPGSGLESDSVFVAIELKYIGINQLSVCSSGESNNLIIFQLEQANGDGPRGWSLSQTKEWIPRFRL